MAEIKKELKVKEESKKKTPKMLASTSALKKLRSWYLISLR